MNQNINAVFISGHARSGTTLVHNIMKVHPKIAGGEETRLFRHFYDMVEFSERKKRAQGIYSFHKDKAFIYDLIKKFVSEYYFTFAQKNEKGIFVEKTPSHELSLPLIKYCFPDAKIVYCLRDGRDVWLSHVELSRHDPDWKEAAVIKDVATSWSESVNVCFNQKEFNKSQLLVVRYEELKSEPLKQIKQMYEFCGVKTEEIPKTAFSKVVESNIFAERHKNYQVGFPGKWKTHMSASDKKVFKKIAGNELLRAGYEKDLHWY